MSTVHNTVLGEVDPAPAHAGANLFCAELEFAVLKGANLSNASLG